MKKILALLTLVTPLTHAQETLQFICVNGNINKIKTTSQCQVHIEELKAISNPNCLYDSTVSKTVKIMMDAKKNNCVVETFTASNNKVRVPRVVNYSSYQDIERLRQYIDAYNQEIGLTAN